jgi:nucleotide-binding universal stress UspA family protein
MYKTIVVAFDDSEFSKAALLESSHWVKRHGGRIILVNAVFFDEEEFGIAPEQREKRLEIGKKVCYQTREKILSEFGITVESLICEGEAPDVIVDVAQGKQADLIAMGTHGRKGLKRLIMGSVTSGVIVKSPVDVIVIKKPCSKCTGAYSSILMPFDGSEFSRNALAKACALAKTDDAAITVLYVIPRYEEMIGFYRTDSIKKSLRDEAEKILDSAREIASGKGLTVQTEIREGQSADEITKAAADLGNDLIVMGTYGWRGVNKAIMGSSTERVIMNAGCPVLVVR